MKYRDIEETNRELVAAMGVLVTNLVFIAKQREMAEQAKAIGRKASKGAK